MTTAGTNRTFMTPSEEILHFYKQARAKQARTHQGGIGPKGGAGGWLRHSMRPHWSDFICDVELAARAVLTAVDYRFFWIYYLEELKSKHKETATFKHLSDRIIQAVTTEWERQEIYPLSRYFLPTHVQRLVPIVQPVAVISMVPVRRGRPRKYKDRAAKQKAYYERTKGTKDSLESYESSA